MIEIEVKIPHEGTVLDLSYLVHQKLVVSGKYVQPDKPQIFSVEDRYFYKPDGKGIRFRTEKRANLDSDLVDPARPRCYVTEKTKEIKNGIETNQEKEEEIAPLGMESRIERDCANHGYVDIGYVKAKSGFIHKFTNGITLNAEAVFAVVESGEEPRLHPVGSYFEIEKLVPETASSEEIQEAQRLVRDTISLLGLDPSLIEPRSWKELCAEALTKESV